MIDFWTYSCINCLRTLPYVRAWYEKYKDQGLVVIGVHAPEFAFEKDIDNVRRAVKDLGVDYPVAIDNDYAIWRAFDNQYWPAHYFIDAKGRIRYHHFGEGEYAESEAVIQQLLAEAGARSVAGGDRAAGRRRRRDGGRRCRRAVAGNLRRLRARREFRVARRRRARSRRTTMRCRRELYDEPVGPRRRMERSPTRKRRSRTQADASRSASMRATSISCSGPAATASRSGTRSRSTASRRAMIAASTSPPTAAAR